VIQGGRQRWIVRSGIGALVALYVGFASYSLVCDMHHALRASAGSHESHAPAKHSTLLCALAHSPVTALPISTTPILPAVLLVALAAGLSQHSLIFQISRTQQSRAPPRS
jgi:hypothetical protein